MSSSRPPTPTWLLAALVCAIPMLAIDNYFAYHAPGAIGSSIQSYFSLDEEDLASLFTMYSAPNLVLVFLGGVLIDRYGLVRTSLVFQVIMLLGTVIFALAPREGGMPLLLLGRFLLGVGGSCICVCSSAMIARWFKHSALTFALGFNSAAVQLVGSAPAFLLLPYLLGDAGKNRVTPDSATAGGDSATAAASVGNVRLCLWVVVIVCGVSLLANLVYGVLEVSYGFIYVASDLEEEFTREMDQDLMRLEIAQQQKKQLASQQPAAPSRTKATKDGRYSIVQSHDVTPINVRETNDNVIMDAPTPADGESGSGASSSGVASQQSPNGENHLSGVEHSNLLNGSLLNLRSLWQHTLGDGNSRTGFSLWKPWATLRAFPLLFWLVIVMQCLLSPILYSFTAFGPQFMMEKYGKTQEEAGFLTSLLYVSIILAPLVGHAIDKIGYRCIIQTVAAAIIPITFSLLHHTEISPYVLMVCLGGAFAITESNGLAMIAEVSPSDLLGTAYGILGAGISVFLLFEPYVVGVIHLRTAHYYWSTVLFIFVSSFGWFATFVIYVYDVNHGNLMTQSTRVKRESEATLEMSEQNTAYPELEIVFDQDDDDDDAEDAVIFSLDDVEAMEQFDTLP